MGKKMEPKVLDDKDENYPEDEIVHHAYFKINWTVAEKRGITDKRLKNIERLIERTLKSGVFGTGSVSVFLVEVDYH